MPKKSANIAIRPVDSTDDLHRATELIIRVYSHESSPAHRWLQTSATRYPGYRHEHTRIASQDHHVLGVLRLTTDTIRIGEARLKMGGLGWVATAPEFRQKGVCSLLIEDTLRYMQDNGYHVSMLFGIPNFYHRFGYGTTLADHTVTVDTMEGLTFDNPFRLVPAKPGDVPTIQSMHEANDEKTSCSILRSSAHIKNKWCRYGEDYWYVLKDSQGRMPAYLFAAREKDALHVWESGVEDAGVCAAVVGAAASLADQASLPRVRFHVPPTCPLARYMQQFASVHETRYMRDAGGMMRFIDLGETLECMIPEWEARLVRKQLTDLRAECTLVADGVPYRLRANKGVVDVAPANGPGKLSLTRTDLMHLVTGYREAADILLTKRTIITPDTRAFLTAIFPKRFPYVWMYDRF